VGRGILNGLLHFDAMEFAQAGAIVAGLTCTVAGYAAGSIKQRLLQPKQNNEYAPGQAG
jgi:hypothetical protein